MKIAMLTNDYPPRVGGIASHIAELSTALARQGHEVHVWVLDEQNPEVIALEQVHARKLEPRGLGWGPRRIRVSRGLAQLYPALIEQYRPDVLHVHTLNEVSLSMRWLGPGGDYRRIFTNHSSVFLNMVRWPLGRLLARFIGGAFDGILAPSRELAEQSVVLGLGSDRLRYVPNGVDAARFSPGDRAQARSQLGIRSDRPVLLAARRFVRKNGLRYLALALDDVRREVPDILCLFCGAACDATELPAVRRVIAERGLQEHARFEGAVPNARMGLYLDACDAVVLPSLIEATSIAGLEAMAAGKPVVGTRVGGIPEIVDDGVTGLLVEPASSRDLARGIVSLLLRHDGVSMGRAARERVLESFTWNVIAERTLAFYQSILDLPPQP